MDRHFRRELAVEGAGTSPSDRVWEFVQALRGRPVAGASKAESDAQIKRQQLEWLADVSPRHERELRALQREEARAKHRQLEWRAAIPTNDAGRPRGESADEADAMKRREQAKCLAKISQLLQDDMHSLSQVDAEIRQLQERLRLIAEQSGGRGANWDRAKHPRTGTAPNAGYFAPTGGGGGSASAGRPPSFLDRVIQRNKQIGELTGGASPGMMRSSRLAADLQAAGRLPAEVTRAAAAGLGTGAKSLVNGSASAIKNVATLGFSSGQLELIGVTKEDRDRGYDKAVAIATASGEVLIAVGTSGLTAALSKGGTIARTTSGALVAYDAAGNAVGVIQGTYDAAKNGVSLSNGTQVAAGLLGLGANVKAARGLKPPDLLPKGFDPVKGFATFEDFKDAFGAAGPGLAWHHVVEQTVNSGKFAAELLHNPANLLKLPHGKGTIHAKISGYYGSKIPGVTGGLKVRNWLSKKSFKEQFDFGIEAIKKAGGSQYLPPDLR